MALQIHPMALRIQSKPRKNQRPVQKKYINNYQTPTPNISVDSSVMHIDGRVVFKRAGSCLLEDPSCPTPPCCTTSGRHWQPGRHLHVYSQSRSEGDPAHAPDLGSWTHRHQWSIIPRLSDPGLDSQGWQPDQQQDLKPDREQGQQPVQRQRCQQPVQQPVHQQGQQPGHQPAQQPPQTTWDASPSPPTFHPTQTTAAWRRHPNRERHGKGLEEPVAGSRTNRRG